MLLKTRGGDPQLVSCKVAGRSHDVRESCRRANMEDKTASTAISSRVVSVWFGLPNMNGIQPDSFERWSVQVERNMSKAILVPRKT